MTNAVHVIGDVHGEFAKLRGLLRDAGFITADDAWTGADSTLWFMGDLVDRGPDGIAVIDLVMRWQGQAAGSGGAVHCLIGNHDALLLAAHRFGSRPSTGPGGTFRVEWELNGGVAADLCALTPEHEHWLTALPAMARAGDHLLVHGDALLYTRYGGSIGDVNRSFSSLLHSDDDSRWDRLLEEFCEHRVFAGVRGVERAETFLRRYGGRQIVHGHTPISKLTKQPPAEVTTPYLYAGGRCLDLDGGMYLGGPGFIYRLPQSVELPE